MYPPHIRVADLTAAQFHELMLDILKDYLKERERVDMEQFEAFQLKLNDMTASE